ncbi:MAG: hypothetical protein WAJ85_09020 [Candidatus Baltobacteraceae bacterium]|jgi:hypothetical protein
MVGTVNTERASRALEFGLYRDGDNNLDEAQALTIAQALETSGNDGSIEFTVEDTTARRGLKPAHVLRTESYTIADGALSHEVEIGPPHDMAARENLAKFVARLLDNAQKSQARETWLDLIDHGGGDGGGLEADHGAGVMTLDDMAGAISDGVALHAKEHPEDGGRRVDGVVANQCLMATVAFASELSHAGVRFLAASPETMLAPGVPSGVAHDIAAHLGDPRRMAKAVVTDTMETTYGPGEAGTYSPAAAFAVIDCAPRKIAAVEAAVRTLNSALTAAAKDRAERSAIRQDARAIDGMVRFPEGKGLPWRADRPAIELYRTFAQDGRLDRAVRGAAAKAADAIASTVLAHRESDDFTPFDDADYSNAYGPTVHFPVNRKQIDAWAPQVSETDNAFYKSVGAADLVRAVA